MILTSLTPNLPTPLPAAPSLPPALIQVAQAAVTIPKFPDYTQNYINTIVTPAKTACDTRGGTLQPNLSCYVPPAPPPVYAAPAPTTEVPAASQVAAGSLIGSLGYSLPYGNCVDMLGVNNPGFGNPISWAITSNTPWIGASALFYFNHVAVVTGIWSNGDIEVRQENAPGMAHRIPPSEIRGFR